MRRSVGEVVAVGPLDPVEANPLADVTGEHAGEVQAGPVWFLCGRTGNPPTAERIVTIPFGKAVFVPILNTFYVLGIDSSDLESLRRQAAEIIDFVTEVAATLDGTRLRGLAN